MAGWKLRKDKAPAEAPGADTEIAEPAAEAPPAAVTTQNGTQQHDTQDAPVFLDIPPPLPDFDADADLHFSGGEFDHHAEAASHTESGPLTLVDYTEPAGLSPTPELHAHIYDAPPAAEAITLLPPIEMPEPIEMPAPFEMPTAETNHFFAPPAPEDVPMTHEAELEDADTDFEPLHSSSWLSSDFSAGIPAVAPFVIDAPAPEALPIAAPQLVVHFGRLSATFAVVKDVTTIGRPDSTLHYYPDIEIEMDDAVSRRHAEIVKRPDGYYLVDTGSTNGTTLNGEVLLAHQEQRLAHGDRIHVGDRTEITFE